MNFDQKAVKFLANFYMNGGQHWTHGGMQTRQPAPPSSREEVVSEPFSPTHAPPIYRKVGIYEAFRTPGSSKTPYEGNQPAARTTTSLGQECKRIQYMQRHVEWRFRKTTPILIDMDTPGPTQYSAPDVSIRESSPHPHYSISCKTPTRWPSPFHYTQPSNLGPQQPCQPSFPAFTFGHRRLVNKAREIRPSPNTYNVIPGFQLKGPRSPAFSMSRAQALNSWVSPAHTPGPAAYYVEDSYNSRFPSTPGVFIQGERRPKRHETGPFCTL